MKRQIRFPWCTVLWLAGAAGALSARPPIPEAGGTTVRLQPAAPTACDAIRVVVRRSFTSDCGWQVIPDVEIRADEIDVSLRLQGNEICLPVAREKDLPFTLGPLAAGDYVLRLSWAGGDAAPFFEAPLRIAAGTCTAFVRGDGNADGKVDLADAVTILTFLFAGGELACEAAADTDASGRFDIGDAIGLLNHLFAGGRAPATPYPACGLPPEGSRLLPCAESPCGPVGPSGLAWMATPDGCVQCQPCKALPLEDVVAFLVARGIEVYEAKYAYMMTCLACDICASGRLYAVLVPGADAEILRADGWVPWKEEPIEVDRLR